MFLWTSYRYYLPTRMFWENMLKYYLKKYGGPIKNFDDIAPSPAVAAPVAGAVKT